MSGKGEGESTSFPCLPLSVNVVGMARSDFSEVCGHARGPVRLQARGRRPRDCKPFRTDVRSTNVRIPDGSESEHGNGSD
jgi:hypothetical protein